MSKMKFVKSAVEIKDYPPADRVEIAVAGRSNAGKSSFINVLAESKIAKVSQVAGKTRLLNFFDFAKYRFVDMPGYGFAARSGDEMRNWQGMVENYLSSRENLRGLVLIMDIRRPWAEEEEMMVNFVGRNDLPVLLVLTKADKCSKQEAQNLRRDLESESGLSPAFITSSEKNIGIAEVEEFIFEHWVKPSIKEFR